MPSETVENYLKHLYVAEQETGEALVPMGRLAASLSVTPGTTTSMVKALADAGLVSYEPRGGVRLTDRGEQLALHVLRRHRLVELFLVEILELDWSEVHEEAEKLEHVISEKVLERIDRMLGSPRTDPHGDPIPPARGKLPRRPLDNLTRCPANEALTIARVTDQDTAFLQFAERRGLLPGTDVTVRERDPQAESVTLELEPGGGPITLGFAAAEKILAMPRET